MSTFGVLILCFHVTIVLTGAVNIKDCPGPQVTSTNAKSVSLTWTNPTATNANNQPITKVMQSHKPGDSFGVGEFNVTYTFTDDTSDLQATCIFSVTVQFDDMEPTVTGCPKDINVNLSQSSSYVIVNWTEPSTVETSYISINKTHLSGSRFTEGVTTVKYIFTDHATNEADCIFNVTVSATNLLPASTIIVIVCVTVVVVILVMGCLVYFLRVRKRRHQHANPQESILDQEMTRINTSATDYEHVEVGQNQPSAFEPVGGLQSHRAYEDVGLPTWAKPWTVPWDSLIVGTKTLGKGQFGEVRYGGVLIEEELWKAAIKKLHKHASRTDSRNFLDEFRSMTKIRRHPNIVRILGACQHEGEVYVAIEYLPNGDLRSYLRSARSMDGDEFLSSEKLLQFALGVAKGMQHLAASGVIHRDLAARNILLDDNLVAKISDFGLSRAEDIYVQLSKTRVPTRWLSLESLIHQTYTTKSDVWSYGILLWEIASIGGTPYSEMETDVLTSKLKTGYRMPKPINCNIKIYDLMLKCWQKKPWDRPSFKKIVSVLTTLAENQDDQIYMSLLPRSEEHKYVNISPVFDDN